MFLKYCTYVFYKLYVYFYDDCICSIFNFSYFLKELIQFNNLEFSKINIWHSVHETYLKFYFIKFVI
jgi:hypothetical protein